MAGFGGRDAFLGKPGLKWQLAPNPLVALDLGCSLPSMTVMGDALPLLCPDQLFPLPLTLNPVTNSSVSKGSFITMSCGHPDTVT